MNPLRLTEDFGTFAPTPWQEWLIDVSRRSESGRWASLARKILLLGLRTPLDVAALGAKLRLYPKDNLCEKRILLTPSRFDLREREILQSRFHSGFRFVDVGANVGLYSLFVAANAPDAVILAFEPQPGVKERFRFNMRQNRFDNIKLIEAAVGDRKGLARFESAHKNRGRGQLTQNDGADTVLVQTLPLYDAMKEAGMLAADAMKLDIEGAEDKALVPFFATAAPEELPGLLIMEANPSWQTDCLQLALDHGYTLQERTRMNLVLVR